jgi:hypothetical protein
VKVGSRWVVDENVLVVANANANSHASDRCVEACVDFLLACRDGSSLVMDEGREMLQKYATHCSHSGQPGVGDLFFVWARDTAASLPTVRLAKSGEDFDDFPQDADLASFDHDDRLWVAGAIAADCPVVNAVDSDYSHHTGALTKAGVVVEELCPDHLKDLNEGC